MKKYLLIFSALFLVACNTNLESTITETEKIINEFEADKEVSDELYIDAKQVFETLELARSEQRGLTIKEKQLVNEFDAKYNRESVELTFNEKMIVNNILLMRYEVIPTSQLESEQERYEEYKSDLLEYVEFD